MLNYHLKYQELRTPEDPIPGLTLVNFPDIKGENLNSYANFN